jgi:uncharacterized protein (TIGR02147 family)
MAMKSAAKTSSELLLEELSNRTRNNPRYSLRAFARLLEMSPGALSEILKGKRPLSVKLAHQMADRLGWSEAELSQLLRLCVQEQSSRQGLTSPDSLTSYATRELSEDVFRIIADWYCLAILSLAEIPEFRADARWIAKRLKISVHQSAEALTRLERVGLLIREKKNPSTLSRFCHRGL